MRPVGHSRCGVEEILAARILGETGTPPRVRSATLAALSGATPIAVSSGARRGSGSIAAAIGGSTRSSR